MTPGQLNKRQTRAFMQRRTIALDNSLEIAPRKSILIKSPPSEHSSDDPGHVQSNSSSRKTSVMTLTARGESEVK